MSRPLREKLQVPNPSDGDLAHMELSTASDCVALVKDGWLSVRATSGLLASGWVGGQGATWEGSTTDTLTVGSSDGGAVGFLLWGSDESVDQWAPMTRSQLASGSVVLCYGTWVVSTIAFERYTLESRMAGPLVENSYQPGKELLLSSRGYWTPQDEWSVLADPRAPNTQVLGVVVVPPSSLNGYRLTLQTNM